MAAGNPAGAETAPAEAASAAGARDLPAWERLEFAQRHLWLTATSALSIAPAAAPGHWLLQADNRILSNREQVALTFDAATGRSLQRRRLSRGRNQRLKEYRYFTDHVLRERRNAEGGGKRGAASESPDSSGAPDKWPLTSREKVAYPAECGGAFIGSAYPLLLLAREVLEAGEPRQYCIHTDWNFYTVTASPGAAEELAVDYEVEGQADGQTGGQRDGQMEGQAEGHAERNASGRGALRAERVVLTVEDVPGNPDSPDFTLLGLQAPVEIFFDPANGIPVELRGIAERVGSAKLRLKKLRWRREVGTPSPAPPPAPEPAPAP